MVFVNLPPGYILSQAGRPTYQNTYPPFNTANFVEKGIYSAPVFSSNKFGAIRGPGKVLNTTKQSF